MREKQIAKLHEKIFAWWRANGRVLLWREKKISHFKFQISKHNSTSSVRDQAFEIYFSPDAKRDPYRVVVSEIMLQQTQVDRVKQKYEAWMKKWPRIEDVAQATLSEVIIEWKGLGYNRRARFLWLLAKEIVEQRRGKWPSSEKELIQLPGIGRYTARAVMSFAFGQQVGVVDTNIKRIFQRMFNDHSFSLTLGQANVQTLSDKDYFKVADKLLPANLADPWNQALMDFGALICTAKSPMCENCPVAHLCTANIEAKKDGFDNFKSKLQTFEPIMKRPKKSKDSPNGVTLKFEQTDRFLRGRIIDELREKEWEEGEFIQYLSTKYTQFSTDRVKRNIASLLEEKMIKQLKKMITLH